MKKSLLTFSITLTYFLANAQSIPNNSFETWTNNKTPDSWVNIYNQPDSTIKKATPAFDGSFALKAQVYHVTASNIDEFAWLTSNFPITTIITQPQNLTFYYKANVLANDSAKIYLNLFNSGTNIGTAVWRAGQQTALGSYQFASVPISYTSALLPDSAEIIVIAGDIESGIPKNGTYTILDKIEFDGINLITGILEKVSESTINIYPNPARESINLIFGSEQYNSNIKVFNILGRECLNAKLSSISKKDGSFKIDVSGLENGVYFLAIERDGQISQQRFIKK